jgi:hypothetical protein
METVAVALTVRTEHVAAFEARFRELAFGGETIMELGG